MYLVSAVSVAVSAISMIQKTTPQMPQRSEWAIGLIIATERGLDFSLAIFLILMLFALNWYTVPLSRNVVAHSVIYTLFFLAGGMSMILRTLFGLKNLHAVDTGAMAATCACFLAWFFLLSAKGEETPVTQRWFAPEQEERILLHLDALNANLLKVTKK
jgi:energy-converting hydrogenase Eha subunit A